MWKKWSARIRRLTEIEFSRSGSSVPPQEELTAGSRKEDGGRKLWFAVAVLILSLTGLAFFSFRDRILGPPEHIVLSLSGSTSLGDELMPKLAEAFLRDELGAFPRQQASSSVLVVGDTSTLNVHLHTDTPELATAVFAGAGEVSSGRIESLR